MVHTSEKKSHILCKIIIPLTLILVVGFVLVAGCSIPSIKNTKAGNSSSPAITPSTTAPTPAVGETLDPVRTGNSTVSKKGQLNISVGDTSAGLPVPVMIDNVTAGNVSRAKPLNLTVSVGRHTVKVCESGACLQQDVLITSLLPTTLDVGELVKKEVISGALHVSIGGFNAELPVFVDNASAGNVSMGKPLDLVMREGRHTVRVCVGILCENETVDIKFGQPVYVDFGARLKKVAEFATPTTRIVDNRRTGDTVTVDVEFINPGKTDLTMTTTIRLAYSYIDPQTHWRKNTFRESVVTKSVKAGTRIVHSLDLYLSGGSAYIIEVPVIVDEPSE